MIGIIEREERMVKVKHVSGDDWCVIYLISMAKPEGKKVWEGHDIDTNALSAIVKDLGASLEFYIFTDENEIDGCTPDTFKAIKGIQPL
jgi:hypothetical protein